MEVQLSVARQLDLRVVSGILIPDKVLPVGIRDRIGVKFHLGFRADGRGFEVMVGILDVERLSLLVVQDIVFTIIVAVEEHGIIRNLDVIIHAFALRLVGAFH